MVDGVSLLSFSTSMKAQSLSQSQAPFSQTHFHSPMVAEEFSAELELNLPINGRRQRGDLWFTVAISMCVCVGDGIQNGWKWEECRRCTHSCTLTHALAALAEI